MPAETPPDTGPRGPRARSRLRQVRPDQWVAILVFGAAVAASSWTWYGLAISAGFPDGLAAVPSISLDLGGIYFGRNWITGRTATLRTWGKITTIAAVFVSVVGNSIQHAIEARFLPVSLPVVLAVGAVPAAVLFGVAHQWSLSEESPPRLVRRGGSGAKAPPRTPDPTVADGAPVGKRATALAYARDHWPVTASEIIKGIRPVEISMTEAGRVRDAVREEREREQAVA